MNGAPEKQFASAHVSSLRGAKTKIVVGLLLTGSWFIASAQSPITYSTGPVYATLYPPASIDLNHDGTPDLIFSGDEAPLCTADIPPSSCFMGWRIATCGTNEILLDGSGTAFFQSAGVALGPTAPPGASWGSADWMTLAAGQSWGSNNGVPYSYWVGSLGALGEGYLGVRFQAVDGLHYGWIRATLNTPPFQTNGLTLLAWGPVILDWAYMTATNALIVAGAGMVMPLAPPSITTSGSLQLQWLSQVGVRYLVQITDQIDPPTWTDLAPGIIATATNTAVALPVTGSARFFRVVQSP